MENTELAIANNQNLYISPVVELDEAKAKFEQVRQYTASCLTKDVDYGTVPGVSKPSLFKPGAEKLGSLFGLTPRFHCVDKIMNWTGEGNPDNEPFFYFEYKCELYRGGEFVSSCDASCNSWEKKYRYRKANAEIHCPKCGKAAIIKGKKEYGGGWVCFAKKGGCGAKFADNDPAIMSQVSGGAQDVKNFDTAEQVNTFQKMAQKRAYVGAILIACNLSEYYTQDVEDMSRNSINPDYSIMEGDFTPVSQPQRSQTAQNGARTNNSAPAQQKPAEGQKKAFDEVEYLTTFSHPQNIMKMSYNNARTYTSDTTGQLYDEMTTKDLYGHWLGLAKQLSNPDLSQDAKDGLGMKISAICAIMWHRKQEIVLAEA